MRLHNKIIILLILGVLFAPRILFCQIPDSTNKKMNRISIQTGLFHYFFDNAPVLNVNHQHSKSTVQNPFKGLLISSLGMSYRRKINCEHSFSIELMSFRNLYDKHTYVYGDGDFFDPPEALVFQRNFLSTKINYSRLWEINNRINLSSGGGINYRYGSETLIVNKGWFDLLLESTNKRDIGLNIFAGIDFTPFEWLTFYSEIDFLGLVYLNDKENIKKLRKYPNVPDHYPSRFDLSLRFGIGVNF